MLLFLDNLVHLTLEAAPWLLFGMLVAGLVKAWVPQEGLARLLGGRGLGAVVNGALIGAPLPICSCGVLPAAIGLRRGGASREATTAFLVATPETGVDSVALSFGMLGPFMAIARPIAAISSAIATGMMMRFLPPEKTVAPEPEMAASSCGSCCSGSSKPVEKQEAPETLLRRTMDGIRYALVDIFEDIVVWLFFGLLLAAATMTWIPPQTLATYGGGLPAMLLMVIIGIPMYICATASTPVAASMLIAGVSPGAAMVFMLAGPATNIATLGVVRQEMGNRAVSLYLSGVISTSLIAGLMTDFAAQALSIDMAVQISGDGEFIPYWIASSSTIVLLALSLKPLISQARKASLRVLGRTVEST